MKKKRYDGYQSYSYLEPGRDYEEFDLAPQFGRVPAYDLDLSDTQEVRAQQLIADSIIISLHEHPTLFPADIDETFAYNRSGRHRTGYEGLAQSGMDAVFDNFMDGTACVTSKMGWKWEDILYDIGMRFSDLAHQDFVIKAERVQDIRDAYETGRVALVPGLEASTPIENEIDRIDILYGFGIRQMGIAYSEANSLGSGLKEKGDGGLSALGARAVERMNKLGIAIDVSHSGDQTSLDAIEASQQPVFITHAGARGVWDTSRMKPDEVIIACAERGGVICLEAAPHTTLSPQHPDHSIESVMDHFRYCVELVGIEHVGFGPDTLYGDHYGLHKLFSAHLALQEMTSGPEFEPVEYVAGLENPTECFPNIVRWLVKHDYSDDEIKAVIGENALRVLEHVWH